MGFGSTPSKKSGRRPSTPVLLLHVILLLAMADGDFGADEVGMVEGLFNTVPELRKVDFRDTYDQWERLNGEYPDKASSVAALSAIEDEATRKKAFIIGCEVALASGDIGDDEVAMLERIQAALDIDQDLADKIIDVLELKYGRTATGAATAA